MNNRKIRSVGAMLLAAAMPVLAADSLAVKTGLWETTVTINMSGMSIPADALAKVPPAQRAQMEQMMQRAGAGAPRTMKEKSCITDKDLKDGPFRNATNQGGQHCTYTPVSVTARHQELTFQCTSDSGHGTSGKMVLDAPDSTHVNGTVEAKTEAGTANVKLATQWLSSSCVGADAK